MMRSGRESKGPSSTDLLVCFPTRSHLTLMPKAICSPARSSDSSRRHHHRHNQSLQLHHLRKSIKRTGTAGQASPLSWTKTKENSTSEMDEPTSPKVTCAGQIKVRQKPSSCKNWQSVMEEIERLHNNKKKKKKKKKKNKWVETLVFKKEVMQFLTCLRSIKLDFRCFGSFPSSDITSDDDDDDDDEEDEDEGNDHHDNQESRTVFSKWFMVLQENQNKDTNESSEGVVHDQAPCAPPPNALLLMRCRSAPAKSWLEEKQEEEENEDEEENEEEEEDEEEEERRKQNLVVMNYNTDFSRFSSDIVKETWVVGGNKDPLSRSRSWKR